MVYATTQGRLYVSYDDGRVHRGVKRKNNPENHTIPPTTLRRNKNNSKQLTLFAGETIGNR